MTKNEKFNSSPLHRAVSISQIRSKDDRRIELSFASDSPVDRFFGQEILEISPGAVRLDRLQKSGALILDHNPADVVGVVERIWIDGNKLRAVVRFGKSVRASEIWQDVKDGIRTGVSFGYVVHAMKEITQDGGETTYLVTDFEPLEISLTSIPADTEIGVGRSHSALPHHIEIKEATMDGAQNNTQLNDLQRRDDIRNLADKTTHLGDFSDLEQKFLTSGRSSAEFQAAIVERLDSVQHPQPTMQVPSADIGLTGQEASRFSYLKVINALANPNDKRAQENAAFEREASRAAAQRMGKTTKGMVVPEDVLRRDLTYGSGAGSGAGLVGTDHLHGSFIEMLRNESVVLGMATTMAGLLGNVSIPRQVTGSTASWVTEGNDVPEQNQTVDQVGMSPKTVGCFTNISRKMLLQGSPDAEFMVRGDLAGAVAQAIDMAAINGSGAGAEPLGIMGTSGVNHLQIATDGGALTWDHLVDLETSLGNFRRLGGLSYLTNSAVKGSMKKSPIHAAGAILGFLMDMNGSVNGLSCPITDDVPSDLTQGSGTELSAMIFGAWKSLVIGMWGGLELIVDPYTKAASGTVQVTALQDVDIAIRQPAAFAVISDIIT